MCVCQKWRHLCPCSHISGAGNQLALRETREQELHRVSQGEREIPITDTLSSSFHCSLSYHSIAKKHNLVHSPSYDV